MSMRLRPVRKSSFKRLIAAVVLFKHRHFLIGERTHEARGRAHDERPIRNHLVFSHKGSSAHDGVPSDARAV